MTASFCCQLSLVGFCTAIIFLSLAYTMYLPTMSGLAMVMAGNVSTAAMQRLASLAYTGLTL